MALFLLFDETTLTHFSRLGIESLDGAMAQQPAAMSSSSSYAFEMPPSSSSSSSSPAATTRRHGALFVGENRDPGAFCLPRACKYYLVELAASLLGLFAGVVAVPAWGLAGAQNMMYVPKKSSGAAVLAKPVMDLLFQAINVLPIVAAALVLAGARPSSAFDVGAEPRWAFHPSRRCPRP